ITAQSGTGRVMKLLNGEWTQVMSTAENLYPSNPALFGDSENLYFGYVSNNAINVWRINGSPELIDSSLSAGSGFFVNPSFAVYNGEIYALYSTMAFGSSAQNFAVLKKYDPFLMSWETVSSIGSVATVTNELAVSGGKLLTLVGGNGAPVILGTYANGVFSSQTLAFADGVFTGLSLAASDDTVLVSVIKNETAMVYTNASGEWTKLGFDVAKAALDIYMATYANRVFVLTSSATGVGLSSKCIRSPIISLSENSAADISDALKYLIIPHGSHSLDGMFEIIRGTLERDKGFIGTGSFARLLDEDGSTAQTYCIVVPGDLNGDGEVDGIDAATSELIMNGAQAPTEAVGFAGDINSDSKTDINDLPLIMNISVGIK
ncbi:MAG: hypothetical protein GX851_00615, partial [Clostridiales bacterium]|nr:hypothetical protein [Clostridiales bacterium]